MAMNATLKEISRNFFRDMSLPYAEQLGLEKLSSHFDVVVYSCLFFTLAQHVIVPALSKVFCPKSYGAIKGRYARNKWAIHGVSMIHAAIIVPLAFQRVALLNLDDDKAFGWDERVALPSAIAVGYFIWDTLDAIFSFDAVGFVLHGFACTLIYTFTFRPFLGYYALRFLLWETSTIFLNFHWFFDKTGKTGSAAQMINGVFLLSSFFFFRIVYGGYMSYDFFQTMMKIQDQIPSYLFYTYTGGNVLLQSLNYFWFYSMIVALKKRFGTKTVKSNGVANGAGHHKEK